MTMPTENPSEGTPCQLTAREVRRQIVNLLRSMSELEFAGTYAEAVEEVEGFFTDGVCDQIAENYDTTRAALRTAAREALKLISDLRPLSEAAGAGRCTDVLAALQSALETPPCS